MSDSRKGKSIWKKFEKPKGDAKVENDGKLFFRINKKTGRPETNYLEWERSWKNVKILKYSSRFANELRTGVRENPTVEEILEANVTLPDLDATREFWIPTVEQTAADVPCISDPTYELGIRQVRRTGLPLEETSLGGSEFITITTRYLFDPQMSDSRKGKSIWKKFEKPKGDAKVENDGKLFFRIKKKTGRPETNYLEWERSWKNVKILRYSSRFANELRTGVRKKTPP